MKHLVIVRHGARHFEGENEGDLTEQGREQTLKIGKRIKEILGFILKEYTCTIISSPLPRALQSAEQVNQSFECDIMTSELFKPPDPPFEEPFDEALTFIDEAGAHVDVVVVVTHYEFTDGFVHYFLELKGLDNTHLEGVKVGEAVMIDCKRDEIRILRQRY